MTNTKTKSIPPLYNDCPALFVAGARKGGSKSNEKQWKRYQSNLMSYLENLVLPIWFTVKCHEEFTTSAVSKLRL